MGYPRQLPVAAIQEVISYFGKAPGVTLQSVIEDAYDVLGFALFTFEGSSRPLVAADGPPLTDEQKVEVLKKALNHDSKLVGAVQVPWALIWTIVQQLINEWLSTLPK
jgi:hypothetical protein